MIVFGKLSKCWKVHLTKIIRERNRELNIGLDTILWLPFFVCSVSLMAVCFIYNLKTLFWHFYFNFALIRSANEKIIIN